MNKYLTVAAFLAQLGICWVTGLIVRHLDYNYSNMLYPLLLRLQATFAEALRPVLGDSMGLTAIILAAVSVSVVALVSVLFWRSRRSTLRIVGYALFILLALVDVF